MATRKRKKKEKLSTRFWNWCERHDIDELDILIWGSMGVSAIFGGVVGYLGGRCDGQKKGYYKGISDLAGQVPAIMEYSGCVGAMTYRDAMFDACDESGHEEYAVAVENLDSTRVLEKASKKWKNDEGVKSITDQLIKGKNGTW